mgnify:FL=1|jgi:hypothetical protein
MLMASMAFLAIFLILNKKSMPAERQGEVKEVLNKDAFVVQFDDARPTIVRFHGISMASESEMLDDQIFEFLHDEIRGGRVLVKPIRVSTGDVIIGELHSLSGEYFNATMVRRGFARWTPSEAADDRKLGDAQKAAKLEQLGVWNPAVHQLLVGRLRGDCENEQPSEDRGEIEATRSEETEDYSDLADAELNPESN